MNGAEMLGVTAGELETRCFTLEETRARLGGMGNQAILKLIANGRLKAVKLNEGDLANGVRVRATDLAAFIASLMPYAGRVPKRRNPPPG